MNELIRRKILSDFFESLSEDEKRYLMNKEISQSLDDIGKKIDDNRHSWLSDFGANVAGNAIWDSFLWIGGKLIKRL